MNDIATRRRENLARILHARFGGSQARLARAIARPSATVWRFLSTGRHAKAIGEKVAREIEQLLGLAPYGLDVPPGGARSGHTHEEQRNHSGEHRSLESTSSRACPVFDAQGAARWWRDRASSQRINTVHCDMSARPSVFALVVSGDSMAPAYRPGDIVFVDPAIDPDAGDEVVVAIGETVLLRQFRPVTDSGRWFELTPANRNYSAIQHVPGHSAAIEILGTVVEHHRYLKRTG